MRRPILPRPTVIDHFIISQMMSAIGGNIILVMSHMVSEHPSRMLEIKCRSGHRRKLDVISACGLSGRAVDTCSAPPRSAGRAGQLSDAVGLMPAGKRRLSDFGQELERGRLDQRLPVRRIFNLGPDAALFQLV